MKRDELVQYITERIVSYYNVPKDERKQQREQAKHVREDWRSRWFGMVPFAVGMWIEKWKEKRRRD